MSRHHSDSNSADKALRLFRILLSSDRRHYLATLCEQLECSAQTVLRLMDSVAREMGENLESGKEGRSRWFRLRPRRSYDKWLHPGRLWRSLVICRDLAAPYLPEQMRQELERELLHCTLTLAEDPLATKSNERVITFFPKGYIDYTPHFAHLNQLQHAAATGEVLRISYRAAGKSQVKAHLFAIKRLICMSGTIYALGADVDANGALRFKSFYPLQRMVKIEPTAIKLQCVLEDSDEHSFGLPWHEPRTFTIKFKTGSSATYVAERIWSRKQHLTVQKDGSVLLTLTTCAEPELRALVRSFGAEAHFVDEKDVSP